VKFRKAAVLLERVKPSSKVTDATNGDGLPRPRIDTYLTQYSRMGHPVRSTAYRREQVTIHGSVELKVDVLCQWPARWQEANQLIVLLPDEAVNRLALLKPESLRKWRHRLGETLFGIDWYGDRDFLSILFLEPVNALWDPSANPETLSGVAQEQRVFFRQTRSVAIPEPFSDLMVSHGMFPLGELYDLVAVRYQPLSAEQSWRDCELPKSIFQLARLISLIHSTRRKTEAIRHHPLLQEQPQDHVSRLLHATSIHSAAGSRSTDNQLAAAYRQHMTDRLDSIQLFDSARIATSSVNEMTLKLKYFASEEPRPWVYELESGHDPMFHRGVVSSLWETLRNDSLELDESVIQLSTREAAITEYFRDYTSAVVTSSNLALQRAVLRLTWIAVVAALLPLAVQWWQAQQAVDSVTSNSGVIERSIGQPSTVEPLTSQQPNPQPIMDTLKAK
jgi:hypothetical protein